MKFSIDRIETDIAVCYDDELNRYEFSASELALPVGSLFEAELDGAGRPQAVRPLENQTAACRQRQKRRLSALFSRKPKH